VKRPERVAMWLWVERQETPWVNHLGKPLYDYVVRLPTWVALAYRPWKVKVEVRTHPPARVEAIAETNHEEWKRYFRENWSGKMKKIRKLNHNYMQIFPVRPRKPDYLSHEEYEEYLRELTALNAKYLRKEEAEG